eukprot:1050633-Amphidinium_carterae.1
MTDLINLDTPPVKEENKELMPKPVPAFTVPPIAKFPPPTIAPRETVQATPAALPLISTPIATETCALAAVSEPKKIETPEFDLEPKRKHVFAIETMHEPIHVPAGNHHSSRRLESTRSTCQACHSS